jgi:hypothetical protein
MAVKLFGKTVVGGEAQRKEAAANEFSTKYPLINECNALQRQIDAAKAELSNINASRPSTAGGKRIKKRNADALGSWINEMKNYLKDLTCGIVGSAIPGEPTTITPQPPKVQPPIVYTKEVIKEYVAPTPQEITTSLTTTTTTAPAPAPTLPSGDSAVPSAQGSVVGVPRQTAMQQDLNVVPQQVVPSATQQAQIMGIPQNYVIFGGIGLVALLLLTNKD